MFHKIIGLVFCFSIYPALSFAESNLVSTPPIQKNHLRACTTAGYAPFELKNSKGHWVGFDIDIIRAFSQQINKPIDIIDMRWEGVFPSLIAHKCDIIFAGMSITEERKKMIAFSNPIYISGNSISILSSAKDSYKSLEDLDKANIKIAVKVGNTAVFILEKTLKNAEILKFDSNADIVNAVLEKRAQAFVQDAVFSQMASQENSGKLYMIAKPINEESLAFGFRKKDKKLLDSFNQFFKNWKKIDAKGESAYSKSVRYYIESSEWRKELY